MASKKSCQYVLTLENGAKFVAAFEIIISLTLVASITLILVDVSFGGKTANSIEYFLGVPRELQFVSWYFCWLAVFIKLGLDVGFLRGICKKSSDVCQLWILINGAVFLMNFVWSMVSLKMRWTRSHYIEIIITNIALCTVKGFEIILVYKLIKKLKTVQPEIFTVSTFPSDPIGRSLNLRRPSYFDFSSPCTSSRVASTSTVTECAPDLSLTFEEISSFTRYKPI